MVIEYILARGGWVRFDWDIDIKSVRSLHENTVITLRNGMSYLLRGRGYGV